MKHIIIAFIFIFSVWGHFNTIESSLWIRNHTLVEFDLYNEQCYDQTIYVSPIDDMVINAFAWDIQWFFEISPPSAYMSANEGADANMNADIKTDMKSNKHKRILGEFKDRNAAAFGIPCMLTFVLIHLEEGQPIPPIEYCLGAPLVGQTSIIITSDFSLFNCNYDEALTIRRSIRQTIYDTFDDYNIKKIILNQGSRVILHVEHDCPFSVEPIGVGYIHLDVSPLP